MKAIWNGVTIAESDNTVVVEGNHYFPADSIDRAVVKDSATTSVCHWKGTASYLTLVVAGEETQTPPGTTRIRAMPPRRSPVTWPSGGGSPSRSEGAPECRPRHS